MEDQIKNINTQQELQQWLESWATNNHIPTITQADGTYMDACMNYTWRCLLDLFSARFRENEIKREEKEACLNVDGMIGLMSDDPHYKINVYRPTPGEDEDGNTYLVLHRTPVTFAEMKQTMEYLKGTVFRNEEYKTLKITGLTPIYYENTDDGKQKIIPLTRAMIKAYTEED